MKGILFFDRELERLDSLSSTEISVEIIADIANSLSPNIQVTVDTPERDSEGRLPVLDMKVWTDGTKILHTFYKKPVSSKFTILKRSAISNTIKLSTLFQESLRRISHISESLPWQETVNHLNEFSNCMRISGYSVTERWNAIRGSIMRLEEMRKKVNNGEIVSINRTKSEIQRNKIQKGGFTSSSWYLKGKTYQVISC